MADFEEQERGEEKERGGASKIKISLAVIGLLGIVGTIIAVAIIMFWPSGGDPAEKALAKNSLQHVITAAETWRNAHDDVYEGLDASKIKNSVSETVVDGLPKKGGQVGITDYNSDRLVLVYVGTSGLEYKATVKSGSIEWDF